MKDLIRLTAVIQKLHGHIHTAPHAGWALQRLLLAMAPIGGVPSGALPARTEANVLTALCFRNSLLEDIHADKVDFDDDAMKDLMIFSTRALNSALALKAICYALGEDGVWFWERGMLGYASMYCSRWEIGDDVPDMDDEEDELFDDEEDELFDDDDDADLKNMSDWPAAEQIKEFLGKSEDWWHKFSGPANYVEGVLVAPYKNEDCPWLIIYSLEAGFVGIPLLCHECGHPIHITAEAIQEWSNTYEGFEIAGIQYINPQDQEKQNGPGALQSSLFGIGAKHPDAPGYPMVVLFLEKYDEAELEQAELELADDQWHELDASESGEEGEEDDGMADPYEPPPSDDAILVLHPRSLLGVKMFSLDDEWIGEDDNV